MTTRNQQLLGKKRKRNNTYESKKITGPLTIIKLIPLFTNKNNDNNYAYIKFANSDKISLEALIQNKIQVIKLKINSTKFYKIYKIELVNAKGNKKQSFNLPIYINKINTCYIDLRQKQKGYSFEFIFYGKNNLYISKNLLNKSNKKLNEFDNYGLKYRKKIILINVEKNLVDNYLDNNIPLDNNSYKICVRIKENGKELSSIHDLQLIEKLKSEKCKLRANNHDIQTINKLFDEFKNKKSLLEIKQNEKFKDLIANQNAFNKLIKEYTYKEKSYLEINKITDNDVNILKEYLLKFILKFFSIDIDKKTGQGRLNRINNKLLKVINNIEEIIDDIEQFTNDKENQIELKYRLYRSTLYNLYSITEEKSSNKEICIDILSEYNQKIINIATSSENNPYYRAIEFLKDLANNLNEDSCLFDLLMQYNSGISDDINLFNQKRKTIRGAENTKFELSMLTVNEIKNHLKDILPNFILRYTCDDDTNGFYSSLNNLIFINEKKSFKENFISDFDDDLNYTLPIVIILIHECWGHNKVYISNEMKRDTPIRNYLKNDDFDENIVKIKKGDTGKIKGESGFELEYLITGSKNINNILSQYLLNCKENNQDLLKVKYWVKPNFNELQRKLIKKIKKDNPKLIDLDKNKLRNEEKSNDTSKYDEKIFFVDGVKIGPLFKV